MPLTISPAASHALSTTENYDWIVFTSKNAVNYFSKELRARKITLANTIRIAAVGSQTAAALRAAGMPVHVIPENFTVRDMLATLGNVQGLRILFPRSRVADPEPIHLLRNQGAHVRVIPLYTPIALPVSDAVKRGLRLGQYSQISFKSPSGIDFFMKQLSAAVKKAALTIPVVCIGPTTYSAAVAAGFRSVSKAVLYFNDV